MPRWVKQQTDRPKPDHRNGLTGLRPETVKACQATAMGSMVTASASLTSSGMVWQNAAGRADIFSKTTRLCLADHPFIRADIPLPRRQCLHVPGDIGFNGNPFTHRPPCHAIADAGNNTNPLMPDNSRPRRRPGGRETGAHQNHRSRWR